MKPGDLVGDRFLIDRLANAGGMGAVYKALDRRSGAYVALKTLHAQPEGGVVRFLREARALAELEHPNIVRYIAHGATRAGENWLAIEWLDGIDLAILLSRRRLRLAEATTLAAKVGAALG